jgi:hypothetical protein
MELMIMLFVATALLGLAAEAWGVDSRELNIDNQHPTTVGLG